MLFKHNPQADEETTTAAERPEDVWSETIGFEDYRRAQIFDTTPGDIGDVVQTHERIARAEVKPQQHNWFGILLGVGILIFILMIVLQMAPDLLEGLKGVNLGGDGQNVVGAAIRVGLGI